uniref:Uncharacterized protein n=1 Tax=Meloidogyne javanica TaxID=6303 RepID=A0A915MP59_MELJA
MSKLDDDLISKNFENDLVATWTVPMSDKVYKIEFEHGTTTGKRILREGWEHADMPLGGGFGAGANA